MRSVTGLDGKTYRVGITHEQRVSLILAVHDLVHAGKHFRAVATDVGVSIGTVHSYMNRFRCPTCVQVGQMSHLNNKKPVRAATRTGSTSPRKAMQ